MDPHLSDRGESQAATHKPLDSLADQPGFLQNNRQREGRSPVEQNLEPPASDFFSSSPQSVPPSDLVPSSSHTVLTSDLSSSSSQTILTSDLSSSSTLPSKPLSPRERLSSQVSAAQEKASLVSPVRPQETASPLPPPPKSASPAEEQDEIKMLESIDEMGGEGGLLGAPSEAEFSLFKIKPQIYRHQTLVSSRRRVRGGLFPALARGAVPVASSRGDGILGRVPAYFLFVLGSGGHTTEMFETIKNSFLPSPAQHRRYVITSGDGDSLRRLLRLESLLDRAVLGSSAGGDKARVGTRDMFTIPRARRVHQPFWTAPFTSLVTGVGAVKALSTVPRSRKGEGYKWPNVIVTNGPGTGFVVALVAYILKLLAVVPQDGCKVVYVESWARINSLSLTGKMFYWSGIAEVFGVQHQQLCDKYEGVVYVGEVGAAKGARMG
ncbi:UDP-N-acetylglucosamine transferase subunit [Podospora pseudopauciseta]|uniref:UDP-N-acetylglucosamine transferase subunit ALG14 n=1 Tax=Podospora pseudopauciseta TaxID=2093780 RepID=A0ABR0HGA1_9PEZI|nr:UDP-N-acetylglucosamine transferase subunit [Podospora pseudopauciseta]